MKSKRLGRIIIHFDIIEDDSELIKLLMSRLIIIRAEAFYHMNAIEYTAICEEWPEIENSLEIPRYHPKFTRTPAGNLSIKMDGGE